MGIYRLPVPQGISDLRRAEPIRAIAPCPGIALRNGRLNQTAYSLFLFIRDIAGGDIVGWIDRQLADHVGSENLAAARAALLDPLRHVYGISDKVIAMALATLLMGAGASRPGWFDVGASFIVVDTLVHNFLHRTGILDRLGAGHPYGPACYRPGGCADVLIDIATAIDARRFNPTFPKTVSAVRAARDLAVLRPIVPRHLQRQSDRRPRPVHEHVVPAVQPL